MSWKMSAQGFALKLMFSWGLTLLTIGGAIAAISPDQRKRFLSAIVQIMLAGATCPFNIPYCRLLRLLPPKVLLLPGQHFFLVHSLPMCHWSYNSRMPPNTLPLTHPRAPLSKLSSMVFRQVVDNSPQSCHPNGIKHFQQHGLHAVVLFRVN